MPRHFRFHVVLFARNPFRTAMHRRTIIPILGFSSLFSALSIARNISIYIYTYRYIHIYIYMCIYIHIAYKPHSLARSLARSISLSLSFIHFAYERARHEYTRITHEAHGYVLVRDILLSFFLLFFSFTYFNHRLQFLLKYVYYGTKRGIGMYGNAWLLSDKRILFAFPFFLSLYSASSLPFDHRLSRTHTHPVPFPLFITYTRSHSRW